MFWDGRLNPSKQTSFFSRTAVTAQSMEGIKCYNERNMERITLGKFSKNRLNDLLREAPPLSDRSERIDFLSKQFLDVPYKESTLIGDISTEEIFVIDFEGVDCFTFLDYVEALRVSESFPAFKENLVKVRYQSGRVVFAKRNHFFTDWKEFNAECVDDVTEDIGEAKSLKITKKLNQKDQDSQFVPGVPSRVREIAYIPSDEVGDDVVSRLRTGDYIGIYSDLQGLDVSHVGILAMNDRCVFLRHASSRHGKVVDEDFKTYMRDKPGIIVMRPKACLPDIHQ